MDPEGDSRTSTAAQQIAESLCDEYGHRWAVVYDGCDRCGKSHHQIVTDLWCEQQEAQRGS